MLSSWTAVLPMMSRALFSTIDQLLLSSLSFESALLLLVRNVALRLSTKFSVVTVTTRSLFLIFLQASISWLLAVRVVLLVWLPSTIPRSIWVSLRLTKILILDKTIFFRLQPTILSRSSFLRFKPQPLITKLPSSAIHFTNNRFPVRPTNPR